MEELNITINEGVCEEYLGNSAAIEVGSEECEVRVDLAVEKKECVRIWGVIKDTQGYSVEGALVKLAKEVFSGGNLEY